MTFGLVLANKQHLIQACDRRLTGPDGKLVDDSAQKSGHILCDDASLLYCFTGLARWSSHTTSSWLLKTLGGLKAHNYWDIIEGLTEASSRSFRDNRNIMRLPPSARRLTIMLSGYRSTGSIVNTLVSNFQDFTQFVDHPEALPQFTFHAECSREDVANPTFIQAIGRFHAITKSDEADLRSLLIGLPPPQALAGKAIAFIQELADRPQAAGTVGKKINIGRLSWSNAVAPVVGYASDETENAIHLLDQIDLRAGSNGLMIQGAQLSVSGSAAVYARVHRNAPCPCGSGEKYKHCHR